MTRTFTDEFFKKFAHSNVGFNKMLQDIQRSIDTTESNYPPYNLIEVNNNKWIIEVAAAGFSMSELDITVEDGTLIVTGEKSEKDDYDYVHRGISGKRFSRKFQLAAYVQVESANLKNGILRIQLLLETPEQMKPRKIAITDITQ